MKETFETNMENGKKEEAKSEEDYQSLKVTKSEELAKAKEVSATSNEDRENTEATLAADTEFLANLKKQCADIDSQWEARSKMRNEEITAVSETIGILTD